METNNTQTGYKYIAGVIVLGLVIVGAYVWFNKEAVTPVVVDTNTPIVVEEKQVTAGGTTDSVVDNGVVGVPDPSLPQAGFPPQGE